MAIFNSYVKLPEGIQYYWSLKKMQICLDGYKKHHEHNWNTCMWLVAHLRTLIRLFPTQETQREDGKQH